MGPLLCSDVSAPMGLDFPDHLQTHCLLCGRDKLEEQVPQAAREAAGHWLIQEKSRVKDRSPSRVIRCFKVFRITARVCESALSTMRGQRPVSVDGRAHRLKPRRVGLHIQMQISRRRLSKPKIRFGLVGAPNDEEEGGATCKWCRTSAQVRSGGRWTGKDEP